MAKARISVPTSCTRSGAFPTPHRRSRGKEPTSNKHMYVLRHHDAYLRPFVESQNDWPVGAEDEATVGREVATHMATHHRVTTLQVREAVFDSGKV